VRPAPPRTVQGNVITRREWNGALRLKALIRIVITRQIVFIRMIPYACGVRERRAPTLAVHGRSLETDAPVRDWMDAALQVVYECYAFSESYRDEK